MKFCLDCKKEKSKKGLYCKSCGYKHRIRPKGLKYKIIVENKGWIKKGEKLFSGRKHSDKTKLLFSKQRKGKRVSIKTEFKKGENSGEKNNKWAGDMIGYGNLHRWVKKHKGKAIKCEKCGSTKIVEWANKSLKYKRDLNDWMSLCRKCHRKYDSKNGWGTATKLWKSRNVKRKKFLSHA